MNTLEDEDFSLILLTLPCLDNLTRFRSRSDTCKWEVVETLKQFVLFLPDFVKKRYLLITWSLIILHGSASRITEDLDN